MAGTSDLSWHKTLWPVFLCYSLGPSTQAYLRLYNLGGLQTHQWEWWSSYLLYIYTSPPFPTSALVRCSSATLFRHIQQPTVQSAYIFLGLSHLQNNIVFFYSNHLVPKLNIREFDFGFIVTANVYLYRFHLRVQKLRGEFYRKESESEYNFVWKLKETIYWARDLWYKQGTFDIDGMLQRWLVCNDGMRLLPVAY